MSNKCPACDSQTFTLGSGTPTHYASVRCADCDRFIRWLPHPKNHDTHGDENALIDRLLACDGLNDWELKFCQSLKTQKKRSPKQREKLSQIADRLGIKNLTLQATKKTVSQVSQVLFSNLEPHP